MPRITGKDAEGLLAAYAKVHASKEEIVEEQPTQEIEVEELKEDQEQLDELGGLGTGGLMRQTSQQPQKQSFGQRQIAKAKMRGNPAAQAQDRMNRGTPVNQLFNKGGNAGSSASTGAQQKPGLGSRIKSGIGGGLRGLGNLAGKAVGGLKRVAGGVADKLTGDRFDFDKRGPSKGAGNAQSGVKPTRQQVQTAKADTTSPAAKAGLSSDMRAQAAAKTDAFNKANNRGKYSKPGQKSGGRPNTGGYNSGPSHTWDSYDPMADVYDDTVNFLVSEGYTEEQSLAIMSEPMFIEAFNEGFTEVLNEQKEV
tara:strand:- start:182 stop:1108 length:927 start_codon:yes stop_codon:yes gene_type:complete